MTTPEAAIEHLDPDVAEVRALIAASDAFYDGLYPAESTHLESSADLKRPDVLFIGCRLDGKLVATGAAKIMQDDEQYRGRGLSRKIMQFLETELEHRGIRLYRLESGIKQPEALGLYRKLGYRERPPFGSYRADPLSVFMEKYSE
jgi:putative acetyltransferase